MTDVLNLLDALVRVESVNPDLSPGGSGEAAVGAVVAEWLTEHGIEVHVEEVERGRPNVIGVVRGTGGGESLMVNAHLDTVGLGGAEQPLEPRLVNGRLHGRGSGDDKGGVAAAMLAAAHLQAAGSLAGDLVVALVADEECGSKGTTALLRCWSADVGIVVEPTALAIRACHKGFVWLTVTVHGVAAHGSRPDLGVDAIAHTGRVLVALEALGRELETRTPHPFLGHGSLHAGLVHGGHELSTYPSRCVLQLERRTIPGETADSVLAEVQAVLDQLHKADPAFSAEVRVDLAREPLETAPETPLVQALLAEAEAVTGVSVDVGGAGGWTDAALMAAAGIPSVVFGPSADGIHGDAESVDVASVAAVRDVLVRVAERICGIRVS